LRTLDAKHGEAFAGIYDDLRGDILAAAGRTDEARKAYQSALGHLDAKSPYRNFVQVKLDTIGGPVAGAGAMGVGTAGVAAAGAGTAAPSSAPAPATTTSK
jgi:hypothetical protein